MYLNDPAATKTDEIVYEFDHGTTNRGNFKVHFDRRSTPDASEWTPQSTRLIAIDKYRIYATSWATAYAIATELADAGIEPHSCGHPEHVASNHFCYHCGKEFDTPTCGMDIDEENKHNTEHEACFN